MPMPVSETVSFKEPLSRHAATFTSPSSVNLTALLRRLITDCLSLSRSVFSGGISGAMSVTNFTRPFLKSGSTVVVAIRTTSSSLNVSANASIRPASILARSSSSLIKLSRWSELIKTFCRFSFCRFSSLPSVRRKTIRVKPMIELSGVRSSWLTLARN